MKCVKKKDGTKILRVSDEKALELVSEGTHKYVPKIDWKIQERKSKTKEQK
jgi:hypothetical protein